MITLRAHQHHDVDAHSPFGGSSAPRVMRCPASVRLIKKVPAHLRKPSAYADRGTALHAAMASLLGDNVPSLDSLAGKTFVNYTLTHEDVENFLRPVLAYVNTLLDAPGTEYYLEQRVKFPTTAGAFGTADLIVRIGDIVHVVDFKFGSGVRVLALYAEGDEDIINSQLSFYAVGARHTFPTFFAGAGDIVLTILQPMSIETDAEMVSSVTVTHAELDQFTTLYSAACAEALSEAPRLQRGAWCRFCPARPICPAHTGPLLDLAQFEIPPPSAANYAQLLARGLDLVNAVKDVGKALHDQAKLVLDNGGSVEGYALTQGRAERHWRDDENTAIAALIGLGLARDDVVAETVRSPKQVELRAKVRGLKIPPEFISSRRSGTSLVRAENAHAPMPGRSELAKCFAAALTTLERK